MFDAHNIRYPNKWSDMSFDYRLLFVYFGGTLLMFASGGALSLELQILLGACGAAIIVVLSIANRRAKAWRWRGVGLKQVAIAMASGALIGFFLFTATPLAPIASPRFFPWYLGGFSIGAFWILHALRIVHFALADFSADCGNAPKPDAESNTTPAEARWKRTVRNAYSAVFLLMWVGFVASFYLYGVAVRDGSLTPTVTQTAAIDDHGTNIYIRPDQKLLIDRSQTLAMIGIPALIISGLILHFLVGVKLFANVPTLRR